MVLAVRPPVPPNPLSRGQEVQAVTQRHLLWEAEEEVLRLEGLAVAVVVEGRAALVGAGKKGGQESGAASSLQKPNLVHLLYLSR